MSLSLLATQLVVRWTGPRVVLHRLEIHPPSVLDDPALAAGLSVLVHPRHPRRMNPLLSPQQWRGSWKQEETAFA